MNDGRGVAVTVDSFRELVIYLARSRAWIEGAHSCLTVRGAL